MVWNNIKDGLPTEEGVYLVITHFMRSYYEVVKFTNDLSKIDSHDDSFKGVAGFYGYSDEWGYFRHKDIVAWVKLPEIPDEYK